MCVFRHQYSAHSNFKLVFWRDLNQSSRTNYTPGWCLMFLFPFVETETSLVSRRLGSKYHSECYRSEAVTALTSFGTEWPDGYACVWPHGMYFSRAALAQQWAEASARLVPLATDRAAVLCRCRWRSVGRLQSACRGRPAALPAGGDLPRLEESRRPAAPPACRAPAAAAAPDPGLHSGARRAACRAGVDTTAAAPSPRQARPR